MKKIIAFIIVVSVVLSSCSNLKNTLVLKRKYNKGFYVAHHQSKPDVSPVQKKNGSKTTTENLAPLKEILSQGIETSDLKKMPVHQSVEMRHNTLFSNSKNGIVSLANKSVVLKHKQLVIAKHAQAKPTFDTELLILVILSLFPFLALIAVFMKDGNNITTNFWIDLLLHFTVIGYIIFALLVVFDIINLS